MEGVSSSSAKALKSISQECYCKGKKEERRVVLFGRKLNWVSAQDSCPTHLENQVVTESKLTMAHMCMCPKERQNLLLPRSKQIIS